MDLLNLSKLADKSSKSLTRIHRRGWIDTHKERGEGNGFVSAQEQKASEIHDINCIHIRVLREDIRCPIRVEVLVEAVSAEWAVSTVRR